MWPKERPVEAEHHEFLREVISVITSKAEQAVVVDVVVVVVTDAEIPHELRD